ncbi:hypothetical protein LEN26_019728 [Aphanomyces euteiches]|nr:hypothetical protein LEN26_019728 [Aphanomyces euteiches]KAH9113550.1 hypothetical protein AeMF1_012257 [Aphanomyces euteiches]KAH9167139.1 hypothetical protein AeNC1_018207 [Aphanomyces euteiches]
MAMAQSATTGKVRFVCISDTHCKHKLLDVPDADVLIHAGDFTNIGTHSQIYRFASWLDSLPHKHKIVIAGNHDASLDAAWYNKDGRKRHKEYQDPTISKQMLTSVCTYLENEAVEIEGIRIFGSPCSPVIPNHVMAFNLMPGRHSISHWQSLPDHIDVLITHTPPLGILDKNHRSCACGDEDLLSEITTRIRPRVHVFGHIHECYGTTVEGPTTFVNASSCTISREPDNPPIVFDISKNDLTVHVHAIPTTVEVE